MSVEAESTAVVEESEQKGSSRMLTWFTVGLAVAAAGLLIGREVRKRYRFTHQTPYDIYEHSAEKNGEFGVGI